MKIQNKILLILIILFSFILIFNIKSSAYTTEEFSEMLNTLDMSIYDNTKCFFLNANIDQLFCYYTTDLDADFYLAGFGYSSYNENAPRKVVRCSKNGKNISYSSHVYSYKNGALTLTYTNSPCVDPNDIVNQKSPEIVFANCNIYKDIDHTDLFFQQPVVEEQPGETLLLETVEQIPTIMVETLQVIIPVGLVILSMVLLIYLIKSVIWRMK